MSNSAKTQKHGDRNEIRRCWVLEFLCCFFKFIFLLCSLVFYVHACLCEGVRGSGTGATDSCRL